MGKFNNNNNRRSSSKFSDKKKSNLYDYQKEDNAGQPESPEIGDSSRYIGDKPMRGLYKSSYAIKADPYEATSPTSKPYPLLSNFNKVSGVSYGGLDNIDGGEADQYMTDTQSKFLEVFDVMTAEIGLNYRYLPINPDYEIKYDGKVARGQNLVDKMRMAINDTISILNSTTFTAQAIYNYAVETDLPMGSAEPEDVETTAGDTIKVYTNITDVIYAMMIEYQIVIQCLLSTFMKTSSFYAYQGELMRMCYDRNTPKLNELFGLYNKQSFKSNVKSLALSIEGEYVDTEWRDQCNVMTNLKSRRSKSILDPLLEIVGTHVFPTKFNVYIYSGADRQQLIGTPVWYQDSTLPTLFRDYERKLSAKSILSWARSQNPLNQKSSQYFNKSVDHIRDLIAYADQFKVAFGDLRTVLDTLLKTGVVRWKKGVSPELVTTTDLEPDNYLLIRNVIQEMFAGSPSMDYDDTTKRWSSVTLWDKYYGIPEYARKQGGIFIGSSTKTVTVNETNLEQVKYLPQAIVLDSDPESEEHGLLLTNRLGKVCRIKTNVTILNNNITLSRLVPLVSQATIGLRVPTMPETLIDGTTVLNSTEKSFLIKQLLDLFGVVRTANNQYHLSPDIMAIYSYQIPDITSDMISYAKYYSPFVGTNEKSTSIGFLRFSSTKA